MATMKQSTARTQQLPSVTTVTAVNNGSGVATVDMDDNVTVDSNINVTSDSPALATNRTDAILRRLGTAGGGLCGAAEAAARL